MANYEEVSTATAGDFLVFTNPDGSKLWIPKSENNADYRAYLESLEA